MLFNNPQKREMNLFHSAVGYMSIGGERDSDTNIKKVTFSLLQTNCCQRRNWYLQRIFLCDYLCNGNSRKKPLLLYSPTPAIHFWCLKELKMFLSVKLQCGYTANLSAWCHFVYVWAVIQWKNRPLNNQCSSGLGLSFPLTAPHYVDTLMHADTG